MRHGMQKGNLITILKAIAGIILYGLAYLIIAHFLRLRYEGLLGGALESELSVCFSGLQRVIGSMVIVYVLWTFLARVKTRLRRWIEGYAPVAAIILIAAGALAIGAVYLWPEPIFELTVQGNQAVLYDPWILLPVHAFNVLILCPSNVADVVFPGSSRLWAKLLVSMIMLLTCVGLEMAFWYWF